MRPGGGRAKGSAFERHIATTFLEAVSKGGLKVGREDCYRTPLSGGHVYASKKDPGDLQISDKILKILPLVVECKNYNRINYDRYLIPPWARQKSWRELEWLAQVIRSAGTKKCPVLIMQENRGAPMVIVSHHWRHLFRGSPRQYGTFEFDNRSWLMYSYATFLGIVTNTIKYRDRS